MDIPGERSDEHVQIPVVVEVRVDDGASVGDGIQPRDSGDVEEVPVAEIEVERIPLVPREGAFATADPVHAHLKGAAPRSALGGRSRGARRRRIGLRDARAKHRTLRRGGETLGHVRLAVQEHSGDHRVTDHPRAAGPPVLPLGPPPLNSP